jgi:inorganic triphosphatase YgiF
MAEEIELKLELASEDLPTLAAEALFAMPAAAASLDATYFDTTDRWLWRHGMSLRIRRSPVGLIQTVKQPATGCGLFERQEWNLPVASLAPQPDPRTPLANLPQDAELIPMFQVSTQRRSKQVKRGRSLVELAIDQVEIRAQDRFDRFCEIELELLAGRPASLFALAKAVDHVVPSRLAVQSKAERGFGLLEALDGGHSAEPIGLNPAMDPNAAFTAVARSCLRQFRLNENILLEGRSRPALHQARVALRRLRSAIALFHPLLPKVEAESFDMRSRALAQVLGKARDLDVLVGRVPPGAMREKLQAARDGAHAAVAAELAAPTTRRLMLDLFEWLALGPVNADPVLPDLREYARHSLDRLRRKLRRHGRDLARLSEQDRHRLRKNAKKLRYAVEFLGSLFDDPDAARRLKTFVRSMDKLQKKLGALNDLAVAGEILAECELAATPAGKDLLASWDREGLLEKAAAARHRILDCKPFWR